MAGTYWLLQTDDTKNSGFGFHGIPDPCNRKEACCLLLFQLMALLRFVRHFGSSFCSSWGELDRVGQLYLPVHFIVISGNQPLKPSALEPLRHILSEIWSIFLGMGASFATILKSSTRFPLNETENYLSFIDKPKINWFFTDDCHEIYYWFISWFVKTYVNISVFLAV